MKSSGSTFVNLLTLTLLASSLLFSGCSKGGDTKPGGGRGGMKFAVEIATVESRPVDLSIRAVGSVEAFEVVPVTARVQGVVESVRFREGDRVSEGQPLVEVESERYRLQLQSAAALLEKSKASLQEARAGLNRRMVIRERDPGLISPEEMEDWQTRVRTLEADSAYAFAELEEARLNQRDSSVPAPVSGTIQNRTVRTGQFVQAGTVIATLVRRDPLLLRFSVSDVDAQRLKIRMPAQFRVRDENTVYNAVITAITEGADPVTRLVSVTAEVTDKERERLRPGAFAEVTVLLGRDSELPLVPQTSVRPSERGFLAYVVDKDSTARERVLTLGIQSSDGLVEVRSGIENGEQVVVRGAEALFDGAPVRIAKVSRMTPADSTRKDSTAGHAS